MPCWLFYILRNSAGKCYVGHSADLPLRLASLNAAGPTQGKFTRKNGPWDLAYAEAHVDRSAAMRREREIKGWKSAKPIRGLVAGWQSPAQRDESPGRWCDPGSRP